MNRTVTENPYINQFQRVMLVIGVIGLLALGAGAALNLEQFFKSYLFGFLYNMGLAVGCFGFLMLHNLTGGRWGIVTRRVLEAGAMTMGWMALLFIPIAFTTFGEHGMGLYHWADLEEVAHDPILQWKQPYLNAQAFTLRAVVYFAIWAGFAFLLRRWSLEQDRTGSEAPTRRMRMLSGIGIALFVLTVTFAAFDWGMSLDPHWFSSIYGALYIVGSGLITLCFMVIVMNMLTRTEPLSRIVAVDQFHDLGTLMFAFTVLWAYMSFGQYVIIWSGNVAEFVPFYIHRTQGGWQYLALVLMAAHFFLPFFLLLSRRNKRNVTMLTGIAVFMIIMRLLDLSWVILPNFHETMAQISWMDIAAPVGMVGVWVGIFAQLLKSQPLIPVNDPNMDLLKLDAGKHHGPELVAAGGGHN